MENMCMLASVIHHAATLYGFRHVWNMPLYPWFVVFPLAFHCVIIAFPYEKWMHPLYGVGLVCFLIGVLTEPFKRAKAYYYVRSTFIMITPGLLMMSRYNCDTNDLLY